MVRNKAPPNKENDKKDKNSDIDIPVKNKRNIEEPKAIIPLPKSGSRLIKTVKKIIIPNIIRYNFFEDLSLMG